MDTKYLSSAPDAISSQDQTARIYLQAEYGSFADTWYIDFQFDAYNNNSSIQIKADGKIKNGVIDVNKPIKLSITGLEYVNLNVGIIWYVNGEIYATTQTSSITFTPKEEGTYEFSAQYGAWPKKILNTVTIKAEINVWLIVTTCVAALLVLIAVGVIVLAFVKKNYKPKEKTEKVETDETIEEKKGPYKPSVTVWLIIGLLISFVILIVFYGILMTKIEELEISSVGAIVCQVLILLLFVFVGVILAAQILSERKKKEPVQEEPAEDNEVEEEAQSAEETQEEVVEEQTEENNEQ